MAKGKAARTECVAQSIGGRNNSATSFWDRILTVEETASLIGVRISELKDAIARGERRTTTRKSAMTLMSSLEAYLGLGVLHYPAVIAVKIRMFKPCFKEMY